MLLELREDRVRLGLGFGVGIGVVAAGLEEDVRRLEQIRAAEARWLAVVVAAADGVIGLWRDDLAFQQQPDQGFLVGLPRAVLRYEDRPRGRAHGRVGAAVRE